MSALPAYKVEIAFNAGVKTPAASRTWTDVTQWVLFGPGIEIDHGRSDLRSTADANTVRMTLNNSDGRFTAGLASSPYFPNVKIGRPIRVTATLGSASTRYVGFVDEWPVEWPATVGAFATATISATSRLAWLGNGVELKSIIEEEVLPDSPTGYYTLGESAGSLTASDTSGVGSPALGVAGSGTAVVFGNGTGPGTDGLTAAQFAAGQFLSASNFYPIAFSDDSWAMSAYVSTTTSVDKSVIVAMNEGFNYWVLYVTSTGKAALRMDNANGLATNTITSTTTVNDGTTRLITARYDGAVGNIHLLVNGVSEAFITLNPSLNVGYGPLVASVGGFGFVAGFPTITATIAHAAFWRGVSGGGPLVPTAARFVAHATAGLTGFAGETPAARLTRYASYAGIAAAELSLETGMVPDLAHFDITGKAAVDCMRTVEATEEGVLFDGRDGTLTFHARNHRYSAASAFTLNVPTGQVDVGISPRLDRSAVRNDVSAQTADGKVTARAVNQASIDDYGPARESLDLATTNAEEPFQHASWLVNSYGSPIPRVPQLGVKLVNVPTATAQAVLAAGIGTRLTVTGMPAQAESSSQDYYIEGYSESIGPGFHDFTFNVSQAEPFDVWTVEDPVLGQYDAYPIAF